MNLDRSDSIKELDLSLPSYNRLQYTGTNTVGDLLDLLNHTDAQLLRRGLSKKSLSEIREVLAQVSIKEAETGTMTIKDLPAYTMPEIKWRDEVAIAAMRSLLLIGAKTESMAEIAVQAYRVADAMTAARLPGVVQILEMRERLGDADATPRSKQRIKEH